MSCSPFDLRDYALQELSEAERQQVEAHVKGCRDCREEVERLRLTEAALFSLRDEEIPQRIAFVSDKIFEPSGWRRAWAAFWGSSARLGFASAALLSVALIVFSLARTAGSASTPVAVRVPFAASPVTDAQIQERVQAAVNQAVAATEARMEKAMDQRIADLDTRNRKSMLLAAGEIDWQQRQIQMMTRASYGPPRAANGENQ